MLEFAIEYRAALDTMTADRGMNLRKFELSKKEWSMATELSEVLQVRFNVSFSSLTNLSSLILDFQARHPFFFTRLPQHQYRYPSHGPHR